MLGEFIQPLYNISPIFISCPKLHRSLLCFSKSSKYLCHGKENLTKNNLKIPVHICDMSFDAWICLCSAFLQLFKSFDDWQSVWLLTAGVGSEVLMGIAFQIIFVLFQLVPLVDRTLVPVSIFTLTKHNFLSKSVEMKSKHWWWLWCCNQ